MKASLSKIIYLFTLCIILLQCSSPTNPQQATAHADSSTTRKKVHLKLNRSSFGLNFDNQKPFEIICLDPIPFYTTFFTDSLECKTWSLSIADLNKIIKHATHISGTEQDLGFANQSCGAFAQLKQDDKYFELELNAGAWMNLICRDTTYRLGDFNKSDSALFLSTPDY